MRDDREGCRSEGKQDMRHKVKRWKKILEPWEWSREDHTRYGISISGFGVKE